MSQDRSQEEWLTCGIDHEVALVEEVPAPHEESQPPLIDNEDALSTLDEGEMARAERAIEARRQQAMQMAADDVEGFRHNAILIKQNVDAGYEVLKPHLKKLRKQLPREVIERIDRVRDTALALVFVAAVAAREAKAPLTSRENLSRIYKFRRRLMSSAEALAESGLVDGHRVALIKAGSGAKDAVEDVFALVALFREDPTLLSSTPLQESTLREAADLATERYPKLKVDGSRVEPDKPAPTKNADLRDRLWTLLQKEWDAVFAAGALVWGTKVTRHLSPLQARARTSRATARPRRTGTE